MPLVYRKLRYGKLAAFYDFNANVNDGMFSFQGIVFFPLVKQFLPKLAPRKTQLQKFPQTQGCGDLGIDGATWLF